MSSIHTIAFYNLENLFDTQDDHNVLDEDFLPDGKKEWTEKRYQKKIFKLGKTISRIANDETSNVPALIGVAEVENYNVLEDLIGSEYLKDKNYSYIHYDSPDERGIDVAMLINDDFFEVIDTAPVAIDIREDNGVKDYTRDALYVHGILNGEEVHIVVTHWPSRRDGAESTSHKRIQAAKQINTFISAHENINEYSKVIIMGDFNDNPNDKSVKNNLLTPLLYNPFEKLMSNTRGSLIHYDEWFLFDQIIFSHNFLKTEKGKHSFLRADIFDDKFLQEWKGRNEGNPFRTYRGRRYLGGYSDHFPVFINILLK